MIGKIYAFVRIPSSKGNLGNYEYPTEFDSLPRKGEKIVATHKETNKKYEFLIDEVYWDKRSAIILISKISELSKNINEIYG